MSVVEHIRACIDRGVTRTLRFYAAGIVFLIWAVLVGLGVGMGSQVVAGLRLGTCAVALIVSFRESARIGSERRKRLRRGE